MAAGHHAQDGNKPLRCPHCGYTYEEPVRDFLVPGQAMEKYHYCDSCEKEFAVKVFYDRIYVRPVI